VEFLKNNFPLKEHSLQKPQAHALAIFLELILFETYKVNNTDSLTYTVGQKMSPFWFLQ